MLAQDGANVPQQTEENLANPAEFDTRTLESLSDPEMAKVLVEVRAMNISIEPVVSVVEGDPSPLLDPEVEYLVATKFLQAEARVLSAKTGLENVESIDSDLAASLRKKLLDEFGKTSLSGVYPKIQ